MRQSVIDNMTIDELAQYVKFGNSKDTWFVYAARKLAKQYFVTKNKELLELDSELKAIYEKHPELIPYTSL